MMGMMLIFLEFNNVWNWSDWIMQTDQVGYHYMHVMACAEPIT